MIRIYFDWNIYSYIRNEKNKSFSEIKELLVQNKTSILLAYSPAHLQDLKRSYFSSEKGKQETVEDLKFLSKLTSNHCLCYHFKNKVVYPNIINPFEYFEEIYIKNANEDFFDFQNILDKNEPLGKLWNSYWMMFKKLPTGIDIDRFEELPIQYNLVNNLFKKTKYNNTFGSLMEDMIDLFQQPDEFEKIYKTIRTNSNKDLKINTDNSKWGNPFEYLDNILQLNKLQKSFFELTKETIENTNKEASRFDYFSNLYILLDVFGYYKDKKVANLMDDASHSFYGAHADIFVTDDDNLNKKSKALYKQLNIDTEVVYSKEFLASIRRRKLFKEEKGLLDQIEYILGKSLLLLETIDDELNPSQVYKIDPLLFDFFNRMQISEYENSTALIFYKKRSNYSEFMFWTEIQEVVRKFYSELGIDYNNKELFQEIEKEELIKCKWKGRYWRFKNNYLVLNYLEYPFGLTFRIEIKKSCNNVYS